MSRLDNIIRRRNHSRKANKRFYTAVDMAEVKHDEAKKNSRIKRGDERSRPNNDIIVCGCGTEGCFIHTGWHNPIVFPTWTNTLRQDQHNSGNPEKESHHV